MFRLQMSRRNARYRPGISLARSGVRRVCRRTNGCSNIGLMRRMDYCATVGFRLPKLHAPAALPIKATSRRPIRVCVASRQAPGGDSSKLLGSSERGQPSIAQSWLLLDSNRTDQGCFVFTRARTPNPLSFTNFQECQVGGVGHAKTALRMQERATCLLGPMAQVINRKPAVDV